MTLTFDHMTLNFYSTSGVMRFRGVYTRGNGARCTMAKIGGGAGICDDNDAFARVYNNLLLHEYIYYFTPVHLLTCCLPYFSILIYQLSLHANSA